MGNELAGRKVNLNIPDGLPMVRLDMVLMEQAIVNLLHNAATYTPPTTTITIEARVEMGHLELQIIDNGPGVPEEILPRLFEKFYRAPGTATGGTGLGLSIVKGLVEAHGGSVVALNNPKGGLITKILLPAEKEPPPPKESDYA